jgi:hypothetical protein
VYTEIEPRSVQKLLNWDNPPPRSRGYALVFPFYVPGSHEPVGYRVRPTNPRVNGKRRNGSPKLVKYETAKGGGVLVYFTPRARSCRWYGDADRVCYWTEGEKKGLIFDQLGLCCVALTGVDGSHDTSAKDEQLHPLIREHVTVTGRAHVIVFDNDSRSNTNVMRAARKLTRMLLAAGAASVRFICPPAGEVKGIDDFFAAQGEQATRALLETAEPIEPVAEVPLRPRDPGQPEIEVGHDLHRVVDEAVDALKLDVDLYQRDGELARIVRVADLDAARALMSAGSPQLCDVPIPTLRERLTRVARFVRYDGRTKEMVEVTPPDRVVTAVNARRAWPGVRPLLGVVVAPTMRPDGSILDVPGYDESTGYVYMPSCAYPSMPERPTLDDARAALKFLQKPWTDLPVRSEADRYVPTAATMTIVARPAIEGACPGNRSRRASRPWREQRAGADVARRADRERQQHDDRWRHVPPRAGLPS